MKSIKSIIKEDIEEIVIYTIIGGLGFLGAIFYDTDSEYSGKTWRKFNHTPIKVEYIHLNPDYDSIKDRVISSGSGLYQEQFGYVNPKMGGVEYLTFEQIRDMLKEESNKNLESELMKYRKEEKTKKEGPVKENKNGG